MLKHFALIATSVLVLGAFNLAHAQDLSLPQDFSPFMGDPQRGPEPDAKHAKTRKYPTLDPIVLSNGNPVTDYGHFRLSKNVVSKKRSPFFMKLDSGEEKASNERWQVKPFQDGNILHYSLAVPPEGATMPEGGFPLLVLQPGIGGIGKKSTGGKVWITDTFQRQFPQYVVYMHPQERTHEYSTRPDGINSIEPTKAVAAYEACIIELAKTLPNLNPKRIYLLGHSMGGSSSWQLMLRNPQIYAAAAPLAGVPPIDMEEAQRLKDIPIWMLVGNDDPWSGSFPYIRTYQNLVKAGNQRVRFWEIQDIGHSGAGMEMWPIAAWLYAQSR